MYKRYGKRILDLFIAFTSILILCPLMLSVAILIKIFDPGPIIFRQSRVGKGGIVFCFFKFRSMPVDTGDLASDQVGKVHLTWVGKFIRRSNIDELPQLFNILKGDMSIVGPRPPIPSQVELLEKRRLNGSLMCVPGLTGLAQISSFDGMSVDEKSHFDALYAQNISLMHDIEILLKTFVYLLKQPPVY